MPDSSPVYMPEAAAAPPVLRVLASSAAGAKTGAPAGPVVVLDGGFVLEAQPAVEASLAAQSAAFSALAPEALPLLTVQLGPAFACDTWGAYRLRAVLAGPASVRVVEHSAGQAMLLKSVLEARLGLDTPPEPFRPTDPLAAVGATARSVGADLWQGLDMLGAVLRRFGASLLQPRHFRVVSFIHQMDRVVVGGLPIVMLMSFIVGAIIAQQSIFQLEKFGASAFVVNLLGILVFRELGLLLAAIMVAGRSGSAFTAEIGSMKMREEIDALRIMGLDPLDILVMPRLLALVVGMPLLNIAASLAAIAGGAVVSVIYGGMTVDFFIERLHASVAFNTVMVGLIKAPFLALVIGIIACVEGLNVKGSAESLGRQTTASVVKAIFMVIIMDGLFAMFFAAINY